MVCGLVIVTRLLQTLEGAEWYRHLRVGRRFIDTPDPGALITVLALSYQKRYRPPRSSR